MAIDPIEARMYSDVVALVNRTNSPLEFTWDSVVYVVEPGKRKMLPRHIALKGIETYRSKVDIATQLTQESLFGIDEENSPYSIEPLGDVNVQAVLSAPKGVNETAIVKGKPTTMKLMDMASGRMRDLAGKEDEARSGVDAGEVKEPRNAPKKV